MKKWIEKLHLPHWLTILLVVIAILRIPSFFEPFSYGDEMIYLTLGEAVRQGKVLYLDIHDNKPPLLYLIAAVAGNVFWFKAILAAWSLITIVLFWKLAEVLFPKRAKLQKVATVIFALLTTLPLLEGNIANAEVFMIGPIIAAFLILLKSKLNFKNVFVAGLLFSVATLFKVPAAFDLPAIVLFWLIVGGIKIKNLKKVVKNTFYLALGFSLPIAITFVWYWFRGGFQEYLVAGFLQNVGYLSSFRPGDVREPFIVRNMPLLVRGGLTALGIGVVAIYAKKLSKQFVFLTLWLLLTLFAVALPERPYPHYLIQSVAPIAFMFAILFTKKDLEQSLAIIPLAIAFIVPVYFKFWYYPTASYYVRFIKLATGTITRQDYLASFGGHIIRSYEIADFISKSTKKTDGVFVWGPDSSLIYALSRRLPPIKYVAQYHISDFSSSEEVFNNLQKNPPKIIVLLPKSPEFPEIVALLRESYIQIQDFEGVDIWIKTSPEVLQ